MTARGDASAAGSRVASQCGRVAIISGANTGIGLETAASLANLLHSFELQRRLSRSDAPGASGTAAVAVQAPQRRVPSRWSTPPSRLWAISEELTGVSIEL